MTLRTYQAFSLADALARIRQDLGQDAVVLHTRTFKRSSLLGLRRRTVYEITATTAAHAQRTRANAMANARAVNEAGARSGLELLEELAEAKSPSTANAGTKRSAQATPHRASDAGGPRDHSALAAQLLETVRAAKASSAVAEAAGGQATARPEPVVAVDRKPAPPRFATSAGPAAPTARRYLIDPETGRIRQRNGEIETGVARSGFAETGAAVSNGAAAGASKPSAPRLATGRTGTPGDLESDLAVLKRMVGQVLQRQAGTIEPPMPDALFGQYLRLIQNEVAQELADDLCGRVRDELTAEQLRDPALVNECLLRHLAALIPAASDDGSPPASPDGRPLTIALVGPTGVGKTTTVAKLAANFKLRHGKRLGLITTDTYRIAAVDQLRTYANIIGVPLRVALTPTEMASACHSLRDCDVILIDTAGRSPNDASRIHEIRSFIDAASPHEVHLVLSSNAGQSALMKIVERFETVNPNRIIFTKLDEAVSLGVMVNVMRKANATLSFVTTGQEVPDHIEPGRPERLARLILEGQVES